VCILSLRYSTISTPDIAMRTKSPVPNWWFSFPLHWENAYKRRRI
jgi:hypothetical protein